MNLLIRCICFTLLCCSLSLTAQTGNVRGFVYIKETGEPAPFMTVYFKGTNYGAVTDINGFYSITKLPAGNYVLMITSMEFDSIQESISVGNSIINKNIYLVRHGISLKVADVSGKRTEKLEKIMVSVNKLDPIIIKKLPTVGGQSDIAQTLQIVPGVVFTGDQGGQLYIRGGTPVQNKLLLDGMIIYNPIHSIGLFSVLDADIIRNTDVYTGGFGAEYGGRVSSIMDITTRDGNKKRLSGKVSAGTFQTKVLIEGPIKKATEKSPFTISYVLSGKKCYLPQTSKMLYTYVDSGRPLPFDFTDLYGKVSFNSPGGSKLNLFGFNFLDGVKYKGLYSLNWAALGGGANFVVVPAGANTLIQGSMAYSDYGVERKEESRERPDSSRISGFNMAFNFTSYKGKDELKYGIEVLGFKTQFQFYNSVNQKIDQTENTTELAAYVKYKYVSGNRKLLIEPSFRAHYYATLSEFSPEPRLGMKYNATSKLRFKFAGGMYSQNLISTTSDRDVVNLFAGYLSGPDNLQAQLTKQNGDVKDITSKLQKGTHFIVGTEIDLMEHLDVNIEVYRKNFTQLTNINRNKLFDEPSSQPDVLKKDFIVETGYAQGIDFLFKYDYKRFYFWVVYSLGYNRRWDGIQEYAPVFDRRHNINLVGSYTMGENNEWEIDARWNFGSGFPFTPTAGFYPKQEFTNGNNTNYVTANESLGILYGDLNSHRLPYYHRLDVSIKRRFDFTENNQLEVVVGASNVYNRRNIFYYDRILYKRVNQLPIMPTISLNWTF